MVVMMEMMMVVVGLHAELRVAPVPNSRARPVHRIPLIKLLRLTVVDARQCRTAHLTSIFGHNGCARAHWHRVMSTVYRLGAMWMMTQQAKMAQGMTATGSQRSRWPVSM